MTYARSRLNGKHGLLSDLLSSGSDHGSIIKDRAGRLLDGFTKFTSGQKRRVERKES
jgi:hypothetical protein